ncbi:TPA: hypothetical protein O7142_003963 [Salmonella enterica]|nr:hypothetical protein [Salmonella enterica]
MSGDKKTYFCGAARLTGFRRIILTFRQLKAADYGAVLANNAEKCSTLTLNYTLKASDVVLNNWFDSQTGTVGDLYICNRRA